MTDLHVTDLDEIKDGWITRVSILAPTGIKEATPKASEPNILDGVKRLGVKSASGLTAGRRLAEIV
jgi:hypothetical protein